MKKLMVICALGTGLLMYACGGTETNAVQKKEETADSKKATTANADVEKGLEMIASLDCTTCHKVEEKNIGPAYRDVANKYEATDAVITDLSNKIIKGGQGVWGSVPMTPHPNVSMDSAKVMVKYIMSLKNK